MKKSLLSLIAIIYFFQGIAQRLELPQVEALHRYEIIRMDTIYSFYAIKPSADQKYQTNKSYSGFNNDSLFLTDGSVTGKLLHGSFMIYYPNGNLKQKGNYKYGLKNGEWKDWDPTGKIIEVTTWQEGQLTKQKKKTKH